MMSIRPLRLGIVALLAIAAEAAPAAATPQMTPFQTIALKDAHSISEAMAVNAAVNSLMAAAGSCNAHGLEAALSCACTSTGKLDRLKTIYHQTSARHPDWNRPNTVVTYANPTNGHFISLNFAAVSGMIGRCEKR